LDVKSSGFQSNKMHLYSAPYVASESRGACWARLGSVYVLCMLETGEKTQLTYSCMTVRVLVHFPHCSWKPCC